MDRLFLDDWLICAALLGLCVVLNLAFCFCVYKTSQVWETLARDMEEKHG